MCGVCGIVTAAGPPDRGELLQMMSRLVHRGPDGCGYYRDRWAALGHTRLAIIDVAGGAQPMSNRAGDLWVTFNGEIFNHVELREELQHRGRRFTTASDTEVVVQAWEEWGERCFERFNGQWALALWDRRRKRLTLSRDRLGIRPLYYARTPAGLLFASEVKALFASPSVSPDFDPVGIGQTMTLWSAVAPRTVFGGVAQLEPGHYAVFDGADIRTSAYWAPSFPQRGREPRQDLKANVEELRERLGEATRLRFRRSDVPVAAYLSGGMDSSITAALIAEFTDAPVQTFSLRFFDEQFDEGKFQKVMSSALGTRHRDIMVSTKDIAKVFPEVVRHTEAPVLRSAPAPLYLLSELVHDHGFKVVVTGEGADEIFAGYDIFRESRVRRFWGADRESRKRPMAVDLLYPWMARSPGRAPAFAHSFFARNLDLDDPALSHRPRWDSTSVLTSLLTPEMREQVRKADPTDFLALMPTAADGWDPLARAQWIEMTTLLAGYILSSQGDRVLMANSVEGRFPFLDSAVVEFANSLPARYKLFGLEEKFLLKKAFADLLPAEIVHRPKQPYRSPGASSFFVPGAPGWVSEVTSERALRRAGVFDAGLVGPLLEKCAAAGGRPMSNTDEMRALAVVSTQLVYFGFIAGESAPGAESALPELQVRVDLADGDPEDRDDMRSL